MTCERLRSSREALPQRRCGVHLELATGLGIDDTQCAHGGQLELARVDDLDDDHVVPARQGFQRRAPAGGPDEVRDDDHETATTGLSGESGQGLFERRCGGVRPSGTLSRTQH